MRQKTSIFHRVIGDPLPVAVRGEGAYIIDSTGKRYLDACGGAAVSCLGHSHPKVIAAMQQQAQTLPFAHTSFFTSEPSEDLADLLVERAPVGIDHVYFLSGGSEAMEAALKLARQYYVEKGQPKRSQFIARRQSYHGNTLGALSVSGNQRRRDQFEPLLMDVEHISPCYPYRDQRPHESAEEYGLRVANELQSSIEKIGAENVIGFVAEPIVGATAGVLVPTPGYFKRIREICDANDILLILDEVMCGMGRTGTYFACEHENLRPDIITVAKGLAGGYQPLGAMLCSDEIFDTVRSGSGLFQHGHTYVGHTMACAAALAVQRTIEEEGLLNNIRTIGNVLQRNIKDRFAGYDNIGDIRGRGLFIGIELVADRKTKTPLNPALAIHKIIKRQAMSLGLACYPSGGTIDGVNGNHILLAPPYFIDHDHVTEIVTKLGYAVDRSLEEIGVISCLQVSCNA
ncbi:MAG TPA: aspartate aminotransferase family protein [Porticoccaceae bacterium]|nr:aspartate aminotransferase family protein [Porticoccaceae bacterium]HIG60287.1 aspartate aminotransferase family protein [Gammaproteobacteria bacterium]HIK80874.1 aspartate aminotransferase family protein [Porticoccaceae bacterium]